MGWPREKSVRSFAKTGAISADLLSDLERIGKASRGSVRDDVRTLYRYVREAGERGAVEGWPFRPF